jgi:PST family polysaccharide transporter
MVQKTTSHSNEKMQTPNSKGLTHYVVNGLLWTVSGAGLRGLLQMVILVLLARLLSPDDFGLVGAALVVVGFSNIFSQLGIGPALVQRSSIDENHIRTAFAITLCFGAFLTALVWTGSAHIARFFQMPQLESILHIMALLFIVQSFSVVSESLLRRKLKFDVIAKGEVLSYAFGYCLVGAVMGLMKLGVWALVGAHLAQAVVKNLIYFFMEPHPIRPLFNSKAIKEIMGFGVGVSLSRIGNYFANQGDRMVIGKWLGPEPLGIYGRAYQLVLVPANLLGLTVNKVLYASVSSIQDEQQRYATAYLRCIAALALLLLPVSALWIALSPEIVLLVLGPKWQAAIIPLQILSLGMFFSAFNKIISAFIFARGAVYAFAWHQAVFGISIFGGSWLFYSWGISAVASAVVAALTINFFLLAGLSIKVAAIKWRQFLAIHGRALILFAAILPAAWFVAEQLRKFQAPPFLILVLVCLVAFGIAIAGVVAFPSMILGSEGIWLMQLAAKYIPLKKIWKFNRPDSNG